MKQLQKHLNALKGRLIRMLGGLLGHPKVVSLVTWLVGQLILWGAKCAIAILLSKVGIILPIL
ncbi:hypothetical protein CF123_05460 [Aeromonas veronii]|uniref:Uncharacterized protein n=1 Tax=Aeromonas veronii TaxID=654 RepID=A0AAX2UVB0_AERVE|nr:hypothetical protein CF123_05460 [Aeromonas veronii]